MYEMAPQHALHIICDLICDTVLLLYADPLTIVKATSPGKPGENAG
jgi:hypothetical protein